MITTWNQWIKQANFRLSEFLSSKQDAEILLQNVAKISKEKILAFGDTVLKNKEKHKLESLLIRRKKGEPIAYLINEKEFWSLNFKVFPPAFIPRPDTECLVNQILNMHSSIYSHLKILDLGSGVGTISLALASEKPFWKIIGIDCQKKILKIAKLNKSRFKLNNAKFLYGNWFKNLQNKFFHIIVSNPPYIDKNDPHLLNKEMYFESKKSLISSSHGLSDLKKICKHSSKHLYPNGWLFLEHGWNQGLFMRKLFKKFKFSNINTIKDLNLQERATFGQWTI